MNSGAVLTLVIALTYFPNISSLGLAWLAFLGALGASILVYLLCGGLSGDIKPMDLTLGGTALGALFFSLAQGILYKNEVALEQVIYWTTGSVEGKKLEVIIEFMPVILVVMIATLFIGKKLNVFSLG
ncbi:iron chelate uptake ABC transporter family permease subunit, partial [Clostridium perfringens]|uniref:iron chelate uptake ABC transporter family permease subunit n=1 Tax=Clostridium perfringens TaxID=1502 RepID=UPI002ACBFEF4